MKILIIKISSLGDVIQCFPAVDFLHHLFPGVDVDWVVEKSFAELLKAHPLINRVFELEVKKWKRAPFRIKNWKGAYEVFKSLRMPFYDLVFDLQGNIKSGMLTWVAKGREKVGFSRSCTPEWPNIFFTTKRFDIDFSAPITSQYLSLVAAPFSEKIPEGGRQVQLMISKKEERWIFEQLLPVAGSRIMVCLGSNWENKKLSLPIWKAFLQKIQNQLTSTFYFVWGNEKEREEVEKLQRYFPETSRILPRMSLPIWQRMMIQMELVLSVDSSALHLAATTGVKTYSFFGPSSQKIYKPLGEAHGAFHGDCPYKIIFTKRCPKLRTCKSGACLKNLFAGVMFDCFIEWYNKN